MTRERSIRRMQEIKGRLCEFHDPHTGQSLRSELHNLARMTYVPKHKPEEYVEWMQRAMPHFEKCSNQSTNHPFFMQMFTVISQHVYGNTIEECLDSGIEIDNRANFTTKDGVVVKKGDSVSVWVSMSGTHILVQGTVRENGVITWCGDGVGSVKDQGYSTNEAAIAAGCPCTLWEKPSCSGGL